MTHRDLVSGGCGGGYGLSQKGRQINYRHGGLWQGKVCEWAREEALGVVRQDVSNHPDCAKQVSEQVCLDRGAQEHRRTTALRCCDTGWI